MTGGETLGWVSLGVTFLLGVFVALNNRRANRTSEKKLTIEEQAAEDQSDDRIAERRLAELNRLYARVEALEQNDREKDVRIRVLEQELGAEKARQEAMFRHILKLELLIPDPPGPPPRPFG